ncbi:MAG: GAF domain-containing protein [Flavobacteriales bacterium]|nr:GAF domain-containing protein [Flavobacteriales bacterium]
MHEPLTFPTSTDRETRYAALLPQAKALLGEETDPIAAMANLSAAIHEAFGWHWVGFYRVVGCELVLGPFQGPVACSRIAFGQGVCGAAWEQARTMLVGDVDAFPGHIACSPLSRSEIVVPIKDASGTVVAVLDIDSSELNTFSTVDSEGLGALCAMLEPLF